MRITSYIRRAVAYWRYRGTVELVRAVLAKVKRRLNGSPGNVEALFRDAAVTPAALEHARFPNLRAIRTFSAPSSERRVTMVTDSVGRSSLFGGVGTAVLLGAHLANRLDAQFRVVTRTERSSPSNIDQVLSAYGVSLRREPQFHLAHIDDPAAAVDVGDNELFLTTSWWTTAALLKGVSPSSIVYLLQEDERMFYAFGDDRLRCEALLSRRDLRFVVNSRLLLDHLVSSGLPHLQEQAIAFEPAFPANVFHRRPRNEPAARKRFFFYARPHNARNLFYLGVQTIEAAIRSGVLAPQEWEFVLIGRDVPNIDFGPDVKLTKIDRLDWSGYAEFCGGVDLALSLMYTPHPSYPPLDLAASGAVVVTTQFGNKQDLSHYSRNILAAPPDVDSLVDALRRGAELAGSAQREANYRATALPQDWKAVFDPVLNAVT